MASFPQHTTYQPGELEERLRELSPGGVLPQAPPSSTGIPQGMRSPKGILTRHSCPVTFPDGASGTCHYSRGGPAWRTFQYEHTGRDGQSRRLPAVYENRRIADTVPAIEEIAQRLAEDAFWQAVARERREYFQRASDGQGRKAKTQQRSRVNAARAKELSGKYALCRRVGAACIPLSAPFDDLKAAVSAWEGQSDRTLVIACFNRLDRRWEEPTFNPLHAHPDYPKARPCPDRLTEAAEQGKPAEPDEDWNRGLEEPESDDHDEDAEPGEYLDGPDDEEDEP